MKINYKLALNGQQITFQDAMKKGYIKLTPNGLEFGESIEVHRSTELVDHNTEEIFENDVLIDAQNRRYLVEYIAGTFFIKEMDGGHGCIPSALTGLKFGNRIDGLKICKDYN